MRLPRSYRYEVDPLWRQKVMGFWLSLNPQSFSTTRPAFGPIVVTDKVLPGPLTLPPCSMLAATSPFCGARRGPGGSPAPCPCASRWPRARGRPCGRRSSRAASRWPAARPCRNSRPRSARARPTPGAYRPRRGQGRFTRAGCSGGIGLSSCPNALYQASRSVAGGGQQRWWGVTQPKT